MRERVNVRVFVCWRWWVFVSAQRFKIQIQSFTIFFFSRFSLYRKISFSAYHALPALLWLAAGCRYWLGRLIIIIIIKNNLQPPKKCRWYVRWTWWSLKCVFGAVWYPLPHRHKWRKRTFNYRTQPYAIACYTPLIESKFSSFFSFANVAATIDVVFAFSYRYFFFGVFSVYSGCRNGGSGW